MLVLKKKAKKYYISLQLFTLTHNSIKCEVNLNIYETFDLVILSLGNIKRPLIMY